MVNNNHFYFKIVFIFALLSNTVFGQSVQELQVLQNLLKRSTSIEIPDLNKITDTVNKKSTQHSNRVVATPELKIKSKEGEWQNIKDYQKWQNETQGDTTVMELYGFVPDTSLSYFGYDIFTSRDSIAFWQNLPAPENYILGSQDEIEISVWGETQLNNFYTINRNGTIYIERVGLIDIGGKTVNSAKLLIENKFKQNYATLRGENPSSFINISINASKTINVHFVGEVNIPGIHPVHPFSSIMTGLIQVGGIKITGSLRDIQIRREGEIVSHLDLYDYILNGNISSNIQLRENDVIIVPIRESTVEIDGAVYRPGIYESLERETANQLINYSGGLKYNSSKYLTIKKIIPIQKRNELEANVKQFLFDIDQLDAIYVDDGDKIYIHSIVESSNFVSIKGQVKREGTYQYTQGMNLYELLNLAGGLEDSLFIKTMHLDEIKIIRKNEFSEYNETIKIDIKKQIDQNTFSEIKLENNDLVIVNANSNLLSANNVIIAGEVKRPGIYALSSSGETLQSIIERAGGLSEKAFKEGTKIVRKDLNVIWDDYSVTLIAGDSIMVKEKPGVVSVRGQVYNPGLIKFSKGRSLKSYVKAAGGVTPDGNRHDILVIYANNDVKPNGKIFFHPTIKEGATILVNKKPDKSPFSFTELLRDSASIAASLAMIYYVVTK